MKKGGLTKCVLLLVSLCAATLLMAQPTISGVVTDAQSGAPLPGASIFISNTQKGVIATADGSFLMTDVPVGTYELVISMVGYYAIVKSFSQADLPLKLAVQMSRKVNEEEIATVRPHVKQGWQQWGRDFFRAFIGESANAGSCEIVNKDVIEFRYYKKERLLEASADEMLVIENKALGYRVKYQLQLFQYDFRTGQIVYAGYPFFEEMKTRPRHLKAREKAYHGSVTHFMQSMYRKNIAEQGFEVRRIFKMPNYEKQRVKKIMQAAGERDLSKPVQVNDSLVYYSRIMKQPDHVGVLDLTLVPADSLLTPAEDSTRKTFRFAYELEVIYLKERPEAAFLSQYPDVRAKDPQTTRLAFREDGEKVVWVEKNGAYINPIDLFLNGYMGWERMADLLPLDYAPRK
jgi:hypothetical protein